MKGLHKPNKKVYWMCNNKPNQFGGLNIKTCLTSILEFLNKMNFQKFYKPSMTFFFYVSQTMIFFFIWIQFLFVDEPGLAVQKAYENEYPQSTKNRYLHFLKDGVSIIAETESQIVGIIVSTIVSRDVEEPAFEMDNQAHKNVLQIVNATLDFEEFFAKHPEIHKVLDLVIVGVDSTCQGNKVGTGLIEDSIKAGKSKGCQAVVLVATNPKSAKIASNLNMHPLKEVLWKDYGFDPHSMPSLTVQSFYKYL